MKIRIGKVPSTRVGTRVNPRGARPLVVRVVNKSKPTGLLAVSKCPSCVRVRR